jgi:uncharacterized membrane protein
MIAQAFRGQSRVLTKVQVQSNQSAPNIIMTSVLLDHPANELLKSTKNYENLGLWYIRVTRG